MKCTTAYRAYSCFIPAGPKLLAIYIEFQHFEPPVEPGTPQESLLTALSDGSERAQSRSQATNDSVLPVTTHRYAFPLFLSQSDTAVAGLESMPCKGSWSGNLVQWWHMDQMHYSEAALALKSIGEVVANYRNSSNNAGTGWVYQVTSGLGQLGDPIFLGQFNLQNLPNGYGYKQMSDIYPFDIKCSTPPKPGVGSGVSIS